MGNGPSFFSFVTFPMKMSTSRATLHFSGRNCCGFDDPHTQCHLLPVRVGRRCFISLLGCHRLQKAGASGLHELQLYLTLDEDFFCCTVSLAGFMP
jgi:hypothetical protein